MADSYSATGRRRGFNATEATRSHRPMVELG